MEIQNHVGAVGKLITAVLEAGDQPNSVARIVLTPAEMQEVQDSKVFVTTVTKYYGDSSTIIIDNIVAGRDGKYISFYLNGILVTTFPEIPETFAALEYKAPVIEPMEQTVFTKDKNGKAVMLVGSGNPVDDFYVAKNDMIELGLAVRIRGKGTNFASDTGEYVISLTDKQLWNFAITVGSLNPEMPNITDMYNVVLRLGMDPSDESKFYELRLVLREFEFQGAKYTNYLWVDSNDNNIILDNATNAELSVTQNIQSYHFDFLKKFLQDGVEFNPAGAPLGRYKISLIATPKWGNYSEVVKSTVYAVIS